MKTYTIGIDEDCVVSEIEETAKVQLFQGRHLSPEELIAFLIAKALAPQSKTAQKFHMESMY